MVLSDSQNLAENRAQTFLLHSLRGDSLVLARVQVMLQLAIYLLTLVACCRMQVKEKLHIGSRAPAAGADKPYIKEKHHVHPPPAQGAC